jgi:hypothetical protein
MRTLGTGVSPYIGLAKHRAFILRCVFKYLARCEWFSVVLNALHNHLDVTSFVNFRTPFGTVDSLSLAESSRKGFDHCHDRSPKSQTANVA